MIRRTERIYTRRNVLTSVLSASGAAITAPSILTAASIKDDKHVLTIGVQGDLRTLHPQHTIFANEWRCTANLYNNLTRLTPQRRVEGDLAESYEAADDARTWSFKLHQGVRFANGGLLTSDDVVATFDKMLAPETAAPYRGELGPIASVTGESKYQVRFRLKTPMADFPKALAGATARIVSQDGIENYSALNRESFGTGPFRLVEFSPSDRVILERNPDYFRAGLPGLDRVVIRILPNPTTQYVALRNRELDAVVDFDPSVFRAISNIQGVNTVSMAGGHFQNIVLLSNKQPFDDPRVRRAAKMCFERDQVAAALTYDTGNPAADHPLSRAYEFHNPNVALPVTDLPLARQLMRQAGFGDGVSVDIIAAEYPSARRRVAVLAQAATAEIGLDFNIRQMDNSTYISDVWNKGTDSYVGDYGTRPYADAILTKLYHSQLGLDEGRWASAKTDALLDQARQSLDAVERRARYHHFQELSRDDGPFIISAFQSELYAVWQNVIGFPTTADSAELRLENTRLAS